MWWTVIELDFQEVYGVDLREPGFLARRSWAWLQLRVLGLLSTESRLQRVLRPIESPSKQGGNHKPLR